MPAFADPAAAFADLVRRYPACWRSPARARALVADWLPEFPPERTALQRALEIGVPDLLAQATALAPELRRDAVQRLVTEAAVPPALAEWAVDSWARGVLGAVPVETPSVRGAAPVSPPAGPLPDEPVPAWEDPWAGPDAPRAGAPLIDGREAVQTPARELAPVPVPPPVPVPAASPARQRPWTAIVIGPALAGTMAYLLHRLGPGGTPEWHAPWSALSTHAGWVAGLYALLVALLVRGRPADAARGGAATASGTPTARAG